MTPQTRHGASERSGLTEARRAGDGSILLGHHDVTLVCGPAGSGKTSLMSGWWHDESLARGRSSVWLTVDARDRTYDSLRGQIETAAVERPTGDQIVFIDDAGLLRDDVVAQLVFDHVAAQQGVRVVLAGRRMLRLPFRPDLELSVRLVGPEDLLLRDEDADAILRDRVPDLAPELRAWLVHRVGGWAAGVHIAANAVANAADPVRFVEEFDGGDRDIADYFESEIFRGLSQSQQHFALGAAVLSEPTGALCDQILGTYGSESLLVELSEANAFVRRDAGGRFRWTPLAREFLLSRAGRDEPELLSRWETIHRWFERNGQDEELVESAVETEQWSVVAEVLLRSGLDFVSSGRADDVTGWMKLLPTAAFERDAGLSIVGAIASALSEDHDRVHVDDWLAMAESVRTGRPPGGAESIDVAVLVTRSLFGGLGPQAGLPLAKEALLRQGQSRTGWLALAHAAIGSHAYLDAEPDLARTALSECLVVLSELEPDERRWVTPLLTSAVSGLLALAHLDSGHPQAAAALISSIRTSAGQSAEFASTDAASLALGRWAQHRDDEEEALQHYVRVAHQSRFPRFRILAHLESAAVCGAIGSLETRDEHVAAADLLLARLDDPGRLLTSRRMSVASLSNAEFEAFTDREREVLRLLESDRSRREIAAELYLSHNTVKTYVRRLYQKLDVSSRPAAVARARERGLL